MIYTKYTHEIPDLCAIYNTTLKEEEVDINNYENITEAGDRIEHFITQVYHQERPHSALGSDTPFNEIVIVAQSSFREWSKFPMAVQLQEEVIAAAAASAP